MRNHGEDAPAATTDFVAVAEELYAVPPAEFTGKRNERAKAVGSRDKALADQVRRLPKPSAAAWAVNMLARRRPEELAGILALGVSLREAQRTLNRDELQRLGRERQSLIAAMARRAGDLAGELGVPISDSAAGEVVQTLQAALADPEAASAVRSGRLVRALASTGFEPPDLSGAVAGPIPEADADAATTEPARPERTRAPAEPARASRRSAREEARARQALAAAEQGLQAAQAELRTAESRSADMARRLEQLKGELRALEDRLTEARRDLAGVEAEAKTLDGERDRASRAAARASRAVDRAREALG